MSALSSKLAARRRDGEEGFTLIELMVVVLIIAILIAIAIPTFLGARQRAQDRASQSSLRNGLTASKTIFTDNEDYTKALADADGNGKMDVQDVEPSLTFVDNATASTGPNQLSIGATQNSVTIAALSKSGTCFYIKDDVTGPGTQFGKTTNAAAGSCKAGTAPASGWLSSW